VHANRIVCSGRTACCIQLLLPIGIGNGRVLPVQRSPGLQQQRQLLPMRLRIRCGTDTAALALVAACGFVVGVWCRSGFDQCLLKRPQHMRHLLAGVK
jgi:hypothetical protein